MCTFFCTQLPAINYQLDKRTTRKYVSNNEICSARKSDSKKKETANGAE